MEQSVVQEELSKQHNTNCDRACASKFVVAVLLNDNTPTRCAALDVVPRLEPFLGAETQAFVAGLVQQLHTAEKEPAKRGTKRQLDTTDQAKSSDVGHQKPPSTQTELRALTVSLNRLRSPTAESSAKKTAAIEIGKLIEDGPANAVLINTALVKISDVFANSHTPNSLRHDITQHILQQTKNIHHVVRNTQHVVAKLFQPLTHVKSHTATTNEEADIFVACFSALSAVAELLVTNLHITTACFRSLVRHANSPNAFQTNQLTCAVVIAGLVFVRRVLETSLSPQIASPEIEIVRHVNKHAAWAVVAVAKALSQPPKINMQQSSFDVGALREFAGVVCVCPLQFKSALLPHIQMFVGQLDCTGEVRALCDGMLTELLI